MSHPHHYLIKKIIYQFLQNKINKQNTHELRSWFILNINTQEYEPTNFNKNLYNITKM